jgi:hypothetical protein
MLGIVDFVESKTQGVLAGVEVAPGSPSTRGRAICVIHASRCRRGALESTGRARPAVMCDYAAGQSPRSWRIRSNEFVGESSLRHMRE